MKQNNDILIVPDEVLVFHEGDHFIDPQIVDGGRNRSLAIRLEAGAQLHATVFVLASGGVGRGTGGTGVGRGETGGTSVKFSLTVDIVGAGAEFHLHGLFIASGVGNAAGHAAINLTVNHLAGGSTSRQLIKGIAAGSASGSFAGLVHIAEGAGGTDATQRNQNIQLSDAARITTSPQLEIYADDVQCSHGATIGRLDEEAVYYMRQRGVGEAEARRMQLHGFAAEIVNNCPSVSYREDLGAKIAAIIDNL